MLWFYVVERLLEYIIGVMQAHTVDNEWKGTMVRVTISTFRVEIWFIVTIGITFCFCCNLLAIRESRAASCQMCNWVILRVCNPPAIVQMCNRAILQMCNRAILVQAEDLPSVSRLLLFKRATFCPTQLSACGYNSQLRGENEHLAWRQELVRMTPLSWSRLPQLPQNCHSATSLVAPRGNFAPLQNLLLVVGTSCWWWSGGLVGELTAF